ncbi:MAG: CRISPR system Cascade subunit CasE [Candidatus Scalindua rubra]|uniref:CRISPR system Cascade subunit CasE n=1 Tax=Candidatus Scalindua rubra TaxID=1872076 RepID=A0A1E3X6F4_9BACT|nr:MAG: CRISPR system Cascade subunit CasE [Candidatus Scalindua rubra]
MKYLSQISISKKEAIKKGFVDSYAWHKALWKAFPGQDGKCRDYLSRIDSKDRYYQILLLSNQRPTLPDWGQWQTKEVTSSFLEYELYRFELRANPTVKRIVRDNDRTRKKNGRRTSICDRNELKLWIYRKAQEAGFEIYNDKLEISAPVKQSFIRNGSIGKHSKVDFKGILKVVNRELFKKAFSRGIGSAKSFSFGMLVLQPIKIDIKN